MDERYSSHSFTNHLGHKEKLRSSSSLLLRCLALFPSSLSCFPPNLQGSQRQPVREVAAGLPLITEKKCDESRGESSDSHTISCEQGNNT